MRACQSWQQASLSLVSAASKHNGTAKLAIEKALDNLLLQAAALLISVKIFFTFFNCNCTSHSACYSAERNTPPTLVWVRQKNPCTCSSSLCSPPLLKNTLRVTAMSPFWLQLQ